MTDNTVIFLDRFFLYDMQGNEFYNCLYYKYNLIEEGHKGVQKSNRIQYSEIEYDNKN